MKMLTIFSAPKPFVDPHIKVIQLNALRSWKELGVDVDVILIGDDPGIAATADMEGVIHLPAVEVNQLGTPLVSSIFNLARENSASGLLMYLNADIILLPETLQVIDQLQGLRKEFLGVGRRSDLELTQEINFSDNWSDAIKAKVRQEGILRGYSAMDYFIFPPQLYNNIPDFAIGRAGWDNWMIYQGIKQPWPVIDLTPSLTVVHQEHNYHHLPEGAIHYDLEESHQNVALGGGMRNLYDLLDVPLILKDGRIVPKPLSLERSLRKIERLVTPDQQLGWRWSATRILRKTRKKITQTG